MSKEGMKTLRNSVENMPPFFMTPLFLILREPECRGCLKWNSLRGKMNPWMNEFQQRTENNILSPFKSFMHQFHNSSAGETLLTTRVYLDRTDPLAFFLRQSSIFSTVFHCRMKHFEIPFPNLCMLHRNPDSWRVCLLWWNIFWSAGPISNPVFVEQDIFLSVLVQTIFLWLKMGRKRF